VKEVLQPPRQWIVGASRLVGIRGSYQDRAVSGNDRCGDPPPPTADKDDKDGQKRHGDEERHRKPEQDSICRPLPMHRAPSGN
jgi:hypothetical protein